jgi:adenosine deaminase
MYDAKHEHTFRLGDRTLDECFEVFTLLHSIVTSRDIVARITRETLYDFAKDNVIYLELRSTPRALADGTTKEGYVQTVLAEFKNAQDEASLDITARLLLSIDRSASLEQAMDTVEIAHKYADRGVIGIDFSGNPHRNSFETFLPAFVKARSYGLKVTVHTAEIANVEDETNMIICDFQADRLGHAVIVDSKQIQDIVRLNIPVEICPTSNLKTRAVQHLGEHPLLDFLQHDHPLSISTDDAGVFNISLSSEYVMVAESLQLSHRTVFGMALRSVDCIFETDTVKQRLRDAILKAAPSLGIQL